MLPASKPAVLVVDDNTALRRLIVRMLRHGGFATLDSGSGPDALALVRRHRGAVDLAIVDMVMPGMSGLDLATDFTREFPGLKILYISGYVGSIAADVLSRLSPHLVLLKPFAEETLLERVRMLLAMPVRKEPVAAEAPPNPQLGTGTSG